MIAIKTMKQISTARVLPSCRSLNSLVSCSGQVSDRGRQVMSYSQMLASERYRQWRNQMWRNPVRSSPVASKQMASNPVASRHVANNQIEYAAQVSQ